MQKYLQERPELGERIPEKVTESELQRIKMEIPRVSPIPPIPVKVDAIVHVKTNNKQIQTEVTRSVKRYFKSTEGKKLASKTTMDAEEVE